MLILLCCDLNSFWNVLKITNNIFTNKNQIFLHSRILQLLRMHVKPKIENELKFIQSWILGAKWPWFSYIIEIEKCLFLCCWMLLNVKIILTFISSADVNSKNLKLNTIVQMRSSHATTNVFNCICHGNRIDILTFQPYG